MDTEIRYARANEFRRDVYSRYGDRRTQCEYVEDYIGRYGSITPIEALNAFGCLRLGARISDLRSAGAMITTEIAKGRKNYAIYRMEDSNGNNL